MKTKSQLKVLARKRRHLRVRRRLSGTAERPRLCVFKSLKHISGILVDDGELRTITSLSTLSPEVKKAIAEVKGKTAKSRVVGVLLGKKALSLGITKIAFDRGGYLFHGRVKALCDGFMESLSGTEKTAAKSSPAGDRKK
ncbi:MAG: 50S ribosomal protein L18 [Candidatus Eisenbacteria bacterium]|nr:50S ribosomal protein L18 [Candidatus Eisenbacteria bacterium]